MPKLLLIPLSAIMILSACADKKTANIGSSTSPATLSADSQPLYQPVEAANFTIDTIPSLQASLLTVNTPWQGADEQSRQLLILPTDSETPEGFNGEVVKGNPQRIVAMSSTNVAMLDAVNALDKLVGVSGLNYISNPNIDRNKLKDVGNQDDPDYELLLSLRPDLVLIYGIDSPCPMEQRLRQFGIPTLYIPDYIEQSPLGKSEWTVAIAHIAGKREQGVEKFTAIRNRYLSLKAKVDSTLTRPVVMLNSPYGDIWYMPPVDSYMVRLIKDAGGEYIFNENQANKSQGISDEQSIAMMAKSDIWLNPGTITSIEQLRATLPRHCATGPASKGKVYNNNLRSTANGGNDFYESGVVNPDIILNDLIEIFHPSTHNYTPTYFRHLK